MQHQVQVKPSDAYALAYGTCVFPLYLS